MATVLVSGSAGFMGGYVAVELFRRGHEVVGIDNLSKYGLVTKSYDDHRAYAFVEGDARVVDLMTKLLLDCDHFIAGAAMIGGISYFHTYAYDRLGTNERIIATPCDAAIEAHHAGRLQKVTYLSSSMVFESATSWPSAEEQVREIPPPISSYGIQKLAVEYFARAAHSQYRLPCTILRRFNCVGIGERRALGDVEILSGNVRLAMSHVVPDLVHKLLKGQDPLHLLGDGSQIRHCTYGGDLAEGIVAPWRVQRHSTRTSISRPLHQRPSQSLPRSSGRRSWGWIRSSGMRRTLPSSTMWRAVSRPPRRLHVCWDSSPPPLNRARHGRGLYLTGPRLSQPSTICPPA